MNDDTLGRARAVIEWTAIPLTMLIGASSEDEPAAFRRWVEPALPSLLALARAACDPRVRRRGRSCACCASAIDGTEVQQPHFADCPIEAIDTALDDLAALAGDDPSTPTAEAAP